jgi:ABC-type phosphate/phosphonate transport system ATPase subunit
MRVHIQDLVVQFPHQPVAALDGVTLNIDAGERVALLGASGSGKTTLLRCLVAAVTPTSGSVFVNGQDVHHSGDAQRQLRQQTGIVRQRDDLVSGLRAQTNAVLGTSSTWGLQDWAHVLSGRVPTRYRAPLTTLARRHGIDAHLTSRIEHLSGGQRQRVALVRALLGGPKLLLADEPTSGLDPVTGRAAVDALLGEPGATVVVSTHDLTLARRFPRVIALQAGRVAFEGPMPDDARVEAFYQPGGPAA